MTENCKHCWTYEFGVWSVPFQLLLSMILRNVKMRRWHNICWQPQVHFSKQLIWYFVICNLSAKLQTSNFPSGCFESGMHQTPQFLSTICWSSVLLHPFRFSMKQFTAKFISPNSLFLVNLVLLSCFFYQITNEHLLINCVSACFPIWDLQWIVTSPCSAHATMGVILIEMPGVIINVWSGFAQETSLPN